MSEEAVSCIICKREVPSLEMRDGSVYRPMARRPDGALMCLDCAGVVPPWQHKLGLSPAEMEAMIARHNAEVRADAQRRELLEALLMLHQASDHMGPAEFDGHVRRVVTAIEAHDKAHRR